MNRQRFLLPAMVLLTIARSLLLPMSGLTAFEEYILECSRHSWGWHEGLGPLLPWMVKASTTAFGETSFGVRFFAPWMMFAAGWVLWELARGLFDNTTASWSLLLFQVAPAVNIAATTLTTTTVGIAGSVAVLAALRLALHRTHRWHLYWWILSFGLLILFMADWRLAMLGVGCAASMALTPRGRRALSKWPVLPLLSGVVVLGATLFWLGNARLNWVGLGKLPMAGTFKWLECLLHLLVAFSPLLLAACVWVLLRSALHRQMTYHMAFLYAFTWPLITLDLFSWASLPWPASGSGTWLAPVCMLLAHLSLAYEPAPPRLKVAARSFMVMAAGAQTCWLVKGTWLILPI
ncbi:MAG: glycosyltransferase family 39 protein [Verrucomicrobium sp.]